MNIWAYLYIQTMAIKEEVQETRYTKWDYLHHASLQSEDNRIPSQDI